MKILLLKPNLLGKLNGADRFTIEILEFLQSQEIEVQAHITMSQVVQKMAKNLLAKLGTPLKGSCYTVGDLKCQVEFGPHFEAAAEANQIEIENHYGRILEQQKPDFVFVHYTDFVAVTSAMKWKPERTLVIISDDEYPRPGTLEAFPSIAWAYKKIKKFVVSSDYMKKSVRKAFPSARLLLIPNIMEDLKRGPVRRRPIYWLFVNPAKEKGVDLVVALAHRLPEERFLLVNHWAHLDPEGLPSNISMVPLQNHLWGLFEKAKGVLMPSMWQEAFGRIAIEAMAAGVPVIASDRGNLPDTLKTGGSCLPLDLNLWVEAMRNEEVISDTKIKAGYIRAQEYQKETQRRLSALLRYFQLETQSESTHHSSV